jgi:hypothetical protein
MKQKFITFLVIVFISCFYFSFTAIFRNAEKESVLGVIDSIEDKDLTAWHNSLNISNYCYGQRLEYEVEGGNYGFSYQTITDTIIQDSGRTVLHGRVSSNNTPRYISRDVYENLQHGDLFDFNQLDSGIWLIKPLMRIDSNVVDNNPDANVVRIDVINFSGDTIASVPIKAQDFAIQTSNYSGKYLSEFNSSTPLSVSGNPYNSSSLNYGVKNVSWKNWKNECKVDFRIWWYGEVDVWLDKVIVDDEFANRLFNSDTTSNKNRFIKQEVNYFSTHSSEPVFFVDEVLFSSIPCIKYVDSIMKSENPDAKLHIAVTNYLNTRAFKDNTIAHRAFMERLDLESFNADARIFHLSTKLHNNFSYYD